MFAVNISSSYNKLMNENAKLFVFSTKEVILIVVFNVFVAITFFLLGVRTGKDYSYNKAGFSPEDRRTLEIKSSQEEIVNDIKKEMVKPKIDKSDVDDRLRKHIENELNNENINESSSSDNIEPPSPEDLAKVSKISEKSDFDNTANSNKDLIPVAKTEVLKKENYIGKYTVQLGSFRTMKEGKSFSSAFVKRGYEPIITEAHPRNKGTWFRVSIGLFNSVADLKDYVNKEKNLFRSQNYIISKIGD